MPNSMDGRVEDLRAQLRDKLQSGQLNNGDVINLEELLIDSSDSRSETFIGEELDGYVGSALPPKVTEQYEYVWHPESETLTVHWPPLRATVGHPGPVSIQHH